MSDVNEILYRNITRDMSAGLLVLKLDGCVSYFNPRAEEILGIDPSSLLSRPFAGFLFESANNDEFIQLILDAIYEKNKLQMDVVRVKNL